MTASRENVRESEAILNALRDIEPPEFEAFCAKLWHRQGWDTTATRDVKDDAVDVEMYRDGGGFTQKAVLQAKRYQAGNNVGAGDIREYNSLRDQEDAEFAIVVTTSDYTKDAREKIREMPVRALDGDDLIDLVTESNALDLVEKYTGREVGPGRELSTAEQKVNELTSILQAPDDAGELAAWAAWKYVWWPAAKRNRGRLATIAASGLAGAAAGVAAGALLMGSLVGLVAGLGGMVVGTSKLRARGRSLVAEYRPAVYEYAMDEIETAAKAAVGATGRDVTVHHLVTGTDGTELVDPPRRYSITCLVADHRSVVVVERARIDVPAVTVEPGEEGHEFFYDQVTRISEEDGELAVYLTDGSRQAWPAMNVSSESVQDIRERIRDHR